MSYCHTDELEVRKCTLGGKLRIPVFFFFFYGCVKSAGCVGGNPYILDGTRSSGYASSIAFDTNMRPRISYYNPDRKKLRLAICGDTACSAGNVAVDDLSSSPNDIGSENDIVVDQVLNTIYVAAIDRTDNVCTQSLLRASLSLSSLFQSCGFRGSLLSFHCIRGSGVMFVWLTVLSRLMFPTLCLPLENLRGICMHITLWRSAVWLS